MLWCIVQNSHLRAVRSFLLRAASADAADVIFELLGDIALPHSQCMHTCTARQEVPAITFTETLLVHSVLD